MSTEWVEAHHFVEGEEFSLSQLSELSGLAEDELRELVDFGALVCVDPQAQVWSFTARSVIVARTARRLREDFELDTHALSVVLTLLERIGALEDAMRALRAHPSRSR